MPPGFGRWAGALLRLRAAPRLRRPSAATALAVGAGACTAVEGATQHLPALGLRLGVVLLALRRPPATGAAWPLPALLAALAALALAALAAPEGALAAQAWAHAAAVVLLYGALCGRRAASRRLLRAALALAALQAAWAVVQRLHAGRGSGGFFSPNDLAAYLAPCAVLAAARLRRRPAAAPTPATALRAARLRALVAGRRRAAAHLALLLAGLWATQSRAGLLAAAAGFGLLAWPLRRRLGRRPWRPAVALAAAGAAATTLFWGRFVDRVDPFAYARADIWAAAWRAWRAAPGGVGLGQAAAALRLGGVPFTGWVRYPRVADHAHCEPLNALLELGPGGPLLQLGAAAFCLWCAARQARPAAAYGVLAALVVPACCGSTLHVPPVALLAAAWAAHVTPARPPAARGAARPAPAARRSGRAVRAATWGVAAALLAVAVPQALAAAAQQAAALARDRGRLPLALRLADLGARLAPYSAGAALLPWSLRHQAGAAAAEVLDGVVAVADAHPRAPAPARRAAQLGAQAAAAAPSPAAWRLVATLYGAAAARDPHDALLWVGAASAFERAGDREAARRAWRRAVAEEPHCSRALAGLALAAAAPPAAAAQWAARARAAAAQAPQHRGRERALLALGADLQARLAALPGP